MSERRWVIQWVGNYGITGGYLKGFDRSTPIWDHRISKAWHFENEAFAIHAASLWESYGETTNAPRILTIELKPVKRLVWKLV